MSILTNLLASIGDDAARHSVKHGVKLGANELRNSAVNAIADNILSGSDDVARNILNSSPGLFRSENMGRTAARTLPDYQNIALTTLDDAPMGFGMVNEKSGVHLTALNPDLMNRSGQKAFAPVDTAWMAPKGMDPKLAQDRFFIDEFGGKKIPSNRQALRDIAWDDDFLSGIPETGWGELNAPITNSDVVMTGSIPHSAHGYQLSSKKALMDNIFNDIKSGGDRAGIMGKINKYLPVVAAVPAAGILGSLFSGSSDNNQV